MFGRANGRTLVVAHRAANDAAPENSIEAIERAIDLGVAVVELDVRKSADGQYVLMHDSTLERTTTLSGMVNQTSFSKLRSARLRLADGTVTEAVIPTFAEAIKAAKGRIWVMIDSKVDRPEDVAEIIRIARGAGVVGQIILYDYKPDMLVQYRALAPEAAIMARTKKEVDVVGLYNGIRPQIFHIEPDYNSKRIARMFDRLGVPTWMNFIGEIDASARAQGDDQIYWAHLDKGPDIVQTDRPAELIALLRRRGLHPFAIDRPNCGNR